MLTETQPTVGPEPARATADPASLDRYKPSWVGKLIYYVLPIRRKVVLSNMRQVFGEDTDPQRIRRLAQCFYSHFLRTTVECLSLLWISERRLAQRVDVVGVSHLLQAAKQNKGILILTGHFGNWEMAAIGGMLQFDQYRGRFHAIRKSLSGILERVVVNRFRDAGLRIIPRRDALRHVTDALAENDVVVFIMDQHATAGPKCLPVDFFGKPAGTNRSLALIAGHSGAPVIPATSYRSPDGRLVLRFFEPLEYIEADSFDAETLANTRRYNEVLEQFVLERPDQWFWMHRRWKSRIYRQPRERVSR